MKSELHSKLQDKAANYLLSKTYWITSTEMPTELGIVDVWGMSRSKNFETCAIEVKVSRADFRSQSQKYKERDDGIIANYNYILCPAGLIKPEEVHPKWGLLWYQEGKDEIFDSKRNRLINKKQPTFLEQTDKEKLEKLIYYLLNGANKPKELLTN